MKLLGWLFGKKRVAAAAPVAGPVAEAATATQVIEVADVEMPAPPPERLGNRQPQSLR